MKRLEGKTAMITGAGAGIGRAISYKFAEEGSKVILLDINSAYLSETHKELKDAGYNSDFFVVDVSRENSVKKGIGSLSLKYPCLDILVNNAADFTIKGLDATSDEWDKILGVNVKGYAFCVKYAKPLMIENGGSIINLSSISAFVAQPNFVTYSTTKGAILSMTHNQARDLAQYNIRVNSISPGVVLTDTALRSISLTPEQADKNPQWGGLHLLNRCARPEEIANVAMFLASDDSSFITGQNIIVDGGLTIKGPF